MEITQEGKVAVERRLKKLVRRMERLWRAYVDMVLEGGICVDAAETTAEFCEKIGRAREQFLGAAEDCVKHYSLGVRHGFLTESLKEYCGRFFKGVGNDKRR